MTSGDDCSKVVGRVYKVKTQLANASQQNMKLNGSKASAIKNAILVFAFQTLQHLTHLG